MTVWSATCVSLAGRGVLIEGPSGAGKSALALALIDRGAQLVGDDGVVLGVHADGLVASPHPRTRGLLEVRNLGLLGFDPCERVPIALVVGFDPAAPRFIDAAGTVLRAGVPIPHVAIWPELSPPALKVEHAMRVYGLPAPGLL